MPWGPSGDLTGMDTVTGVLLRTPGLFVIDYWYWFQRNKSGAESSSFTTEMVAYFALANGFLLLLLPISLLRAFYSHFLCGALVLAAHLLSCCIVRIGTNDSHPSLIPTPSLPVHPAAEAAEKMVGDVVADSAPVKLMSLLFLHVVIAMIVSCLLRRPTKPVLPILACYSLPVMARLADVPAHSIQILHNLCFVVIGLSLVRYFVCNSVVSLFSSLKGTYNALVSSITSIQGLVELVISFVGKIFVPIHFLLFCVISFAIKLQQISFSDTDHQSDTWFLTLLSVAAAVCDSPVSLLSVAVTVTYISHIFLTAVKLYLNSFGYRHHVFHSDNDNDPDQIHPHHIGANNHRANQVQPRAMHTGWEEGVTTLLLAVLTGITELGQTARMAVLTIIFFVVISSLLQSMLEIAEPVILSLSAHHGKNLFHHLKVLLLCAFLFAFPLYITYVLTTVFPVDFWLAVVLSTSLLTSAQVLDLVVVHCLLWFDATRAEPWDPLDEVVYHVRAFTKVVEFMVAFSVVVVGVYEGMIGQWNWTNALILIVHCYFNVCQRFQSGLRSFIQRRRAVQKSCNLPAATLHQLHEYRDVCAICFMDMITVSTSVITPCSHFFHRVCLRRWLSFHDRCPLCAAPVISDALSKDLPDCDRPAAPPSD